MNKFRPNALSIAMMITGLVGGIAVGLFGWMGGFLGTSTFVDGAIFGATISLFVAILVLGVNSLASLASQVATDPSPAQFPAKEAIELVKAVKNDETS